MTKWNATDEADTFIASANSRETSKEIMQAIAFFARNLEEAESLWADGYGAATVGDIWEHVTKNGLHDAREFVWGAAGDSWAE